MSALRDFDRPLLRLNESPERVDGCHWHKTVVGHDRSFERAGCAAREQTFAADHSLIEASFLANCFIRIRQKRLVTTKPLPIDVSQAMSGSAEIYVPVQFP